MRAGHTGVIRVFLANKKVFSALSLLLLLVVFWNTKKILVFRSSSVYPRSMIDSLQHLDGLERVCSSPSV